MAANSSQYLDEQARQHGDTSPETLLRQLNENWTKLRLFERTVADRDRVIDGLHTSLAERDDVIDGLKKRLSFARVRVVLLYSLVGGIAAEGVKEIVKAIFLHWMRHQ